MKLSENFSLTEATKSQVALRLGIENTLPPPEVIENMRVLAKKVLEPVRAHFGKPFTPSSWYRSKVLNDAVNGHPSSQHMTGAAADIEVPGVPNAVLAAWIRDNCDFDQVILEHYDPTEPSSGWVHVSVACGHIPRQQVLTINRHGTSDGIIGPDGSQLA